MFVQKSQKYILTYKLTSLNNIATPPHESPVTKKSQYQLFQANLPTSKCMIFYNDPNTSALQKIMKVFYHFFCVDLKL